MQIAGPLRELTIPTAASEDEPFERLVILYERLVARTALRLLGRPDEAEDATQEVFLRLYSNLGKLRADSVVPAWLYRVTVNVCRDIVRKRPPFAGIEYAPEPHAPAPDDAGEFEERKRMLVAGMKTLTQRERECLTLSDIEGLSGREVAGIAGCSEVTVRSHVSSARAKLREFARRRNL